MEVVFPVNLEISMKMLSSPKTEFSKLMQIEPSFNMGLKEVWGFKGDHRLAAT